MNRNIKAILALIIFMWALTIYVIIAFNKPDNKPPTSNPPEPQQVQIIKVKATAFNIYGHDVNGIDYGPGYVIISTESDIPLYSLLDIDVCGECQALGMSPYLAKDEIKIWYNAPSDIPLFGTQTAYVRVIEKGDKPCRLNK